jgi:auxin-responsive protein IAA
MASSSGSGISSVLSRGEDDNSTVMSSEDSSDDHDGGPAAKLELDLTLAVGGGNNCKESLSVARDFEFCSSSSSSTTTQTRGKANNGNATVGTKRSAADSVSSQVVGWPPIRAYRMNSMANHSKSVATEGFNSIVEINKSNTTVVEKANLSTNNTSRDAKVRTSHFVKVNMDGIPIGRKVDLTAHSCYETLAQMLEDMFVQRTKTVNAMRPGRRSKLLDGSSEFVLTYEDKEGDWMLVGDVPWGMFLGSIKRLRIMKTSNATGLAPRT